MRHEPNSEEPDRCRATDLLITDCSGCRGSDETFVNALLSGERDPQADYEKAQPNDRLKPSLDPLARDGRLVAHGKWWLDTGPPTVLIADSHEFKASYGGGGGCKACPDPIRTGQMIVHVNVGGYAHVKCLKGER